MSEHDSRFYSSPRHQIQVDFDRIMDELGEQFGAKPNLTKLFFSDPVLWYHVYFGPLLPYHYRINGPHAWSGARKAIMTVDERIQAPLQTRKLINVSTKSNDNLGILMSHQILVSIIHNKNITIKIFKETMFHEIETWTNSCFLWYHVYFGPLLPYHYRINGPHAWSGARKAIMTVDERIQAPLQTRKLINVSTKSNDNLGMASFIIPIFAILICLIKFWFP
uniref:Flavin-containing monooxygenase n=1 Tax=Tetranychus urticae TaxID=32264 RepID=T1KVA8_TETUR